MAFSVSPNTNNDHFFAMPAPEPSSTSSPPVADAQKSFETAVFMQETLHSPDDVTSQSLVAINNKLASLDKATLEDAIARIDSDTLDTWTSKATGNYEKPDGLMPQKEGDRIVNLLFKDPKTALTPNSLAQKKILNSFTNIGFSGGKSGFISLYRGYDDEIDVNSIVWSNQQAHPTGNDFPSYEPKISSPQNSTAVVNFVKDKASGYVSHNDLSYVNQRLELLSRDEINEFVKQIPADTLNTWSNQANDDDAWFDAGKGLFGYEKTHLYYELNGYEGEKPLSPEAQQKITASFNYLKPA